MFISESNLLGTTLCLVVILIFLYWLYITVVRDEFKSGWNRFTSAYLGSNHAKILVASTLTIIMFTFISFSSILFIMSVLILSLVLLDITILPDLFDSGWNSFRSVSFESNPLGTSLLIIVVLVFSLHLMNFTIVTNLLLSGWNFFTLIIPGLSVVEILVESTVTTTALVFGSFSSSVLFIGVLIIPLHLLKITIVTDCLKSIWTHFMSANPRENCAKILGTLTLTITTFICVPFLSPLLVFGVLVFSLCVLKFTTVTESFQSSWNLVRSVRQGEPHVKTFGEAIKFIFESNPLGTSFLIIVVSVFSLHLMNFTIVTDLLLSGWNFFTLIIPGLSFVEILVEPTVTTTTLVFGSFSPTVLFIGVLIISLPLLKVTTVIILYIFKKVHNSERLVKTVIEKSTLLTPETGSLPTYKLPLKEKQNSTNGCKYFSFGRKCTKPNRTIVLVGATGAGKTAVISGMINHILGVKWKDLYRFKLVHEGQAMSQDPSEVTVYKIYHQEGFKIDHSLTIVDIPDFGDTKNLKVNEQLRKLFYSLLVSEVDAVCFVAPASLTRLSPAQESVFDSIFSVFGKDVAENIRILVTFADDQQPAVLEAIKASGIPCPKSKDGLPIHFKFNDSVLFVDKDTAGRSHKSDQVLWNMGASSMRSFFAALISIKTIKLTLTSEALGGRQQVESSVEDLQMQVKLSLAKLEKIRETMEKVKENEAEVNKNEDFEFYVIIKKPVKIDISHTGQYITNCQQCQVTCHYPCGIPNDDGKRGCSAMGQDGYCTVCPGKCFWNVHFNQTFKWEYREFKEKQTVKNLKENIDEDTEEKMTGKWLIEGLQAEYDEVEKEMIKVIELSAQCLNRLKEMMKNPNPLSILEYIDMLIEGEKKEAKPGWNQRVDSLMKVREKA